ncbi:MAG TPA: hypothetical protein VGC69_17895 [Bordetella sp.]
MSTTTKQKGRDSSKSATQTTKLDDNVAKRPQYGTDEALKAALTAHATTPAEYERACHLAADLAWA